MVEHYICTYHFLSFFYSPMPSRQGGETFGNYMGKHLAIFLTLSAHQNASFRTPLKSSKSPKTQGIAASYRQFPLPLFVIRLGLLGKAGDM
jgi:hypothetical protein